MAERERHNTPEFEERAEEFIQRVNGLIIIFPHTDFYVVNFSKTSIDSQKKLISWYQANNFSQFAGIERDTLKEMEISAKYKTVVQVEATDNFHKVLETFIGEVDFLASKLAGEKLRNPLFRDLGTNLNGEPRFKSIQNYTFTKSLFA